MNTNTLSPSLSRHETRFHLRIKEWARGREFMGPFLAFLVVLAPIPLASNRPVFWLGLSAIFMMLAAFHLMIAHQRPTDLDAGYWMNRVFVLGTVMPLTICLQLLPLPTLQSIMPAASALAILRLIGIGAFAYLIFQTALRLVSPRPLIWIVFLGILTHAIWAMISLTLLADDPIFFVKTSYLGVATGTFVNRNSFATFLGIGIILGIAIASSSDRPKASKTHPSALLECGAYAVAIGLIVLTLLATQSRMGCLSTLIGVGVYLTFTAPMGSRPARPRNRLLLTGLILVVILATAGAANGLLLRFASLSGAPIDRMTLYADILPMIADRPWLGFGADSFATAFTAYQSPELPNHLTWDHAHSTYLENWVEYGVFAGTVPAAIGALTWRRLRQVQRTEVRREPWAAAALGSLALVACHALVDFSLEMPANAYLLVFVLGVTAAQPTQIRGFHARH
jgi:O-antigen ligase